MKNNAQIDHRIQKQKAQADIYRLKANSLKGHPDKGLQRELLLTKSKLCELKARDLIRADKDQSN